MIKELNREDIQISKFLSLILRHRPDKIGLKLDENGWVDIDELIPSVQKEFPKFTLKKLKEIVHNNDKQRFELNPDSKKIRANQGHSLKVNLDLKAKEPPEFLYHGTTLKVLPSIKSNGILKGRRQYVHLSKDKETALKVGSRHGKPVVLQIKSKKMHQQGIIFYLSKNSVWLTDFVGTEFIIFKNKNTSNDFFIPKSQLDILDKIKNQK